MKEKFNVGTPTEENIIYAFKNLIFYVDASIYLDMYNDYSKQFKKVFDKINEVLDIYINEKKLSVIDINKLQDIRYDLIDLDTATQRLKSYYAEWSLQWAEAIISLRTSEINKGGK